jgi:formylglycine-generating enzyme required for sulfatase activity
MVFVPGGTFRMGSDMHYLEEAPAQLVTVDSFWMDETSVTNAKFQKFVEETSYVTFAEIAPKPPETQECTDEPLPELEAGSLGNSVSVRSTSEPSIFLSSRLRTSKTAWSNAYRCSVPSLGESPAVNLRGLSW